MSDVPHYRFVHDPLTDCQCSLEDCEAGRPGALVPALHYARLERELGEARRLNALYAYPPEHRVSVAETERDTMQAALERIVVKAADLREKPGEALMYIENIARAALQRTPKRGAEVAACTTCDGRGFIEKYMGGAGPDLDVQTDRCDDCDGSGKATDQPDEGQGE